METPTSKPATPPKPSETPPSAPSVPTPGPHPDSRANAVLAAALALVGVAEQGGENRGPLIDFAHTGFIASVDETADAYVCTTIEGNTNTDGSREGTSVCLRARTFLKGSAHRFVTWRGL